VDDEAADPMLHNPAPADTTGALDPNPFNIPNFDTFGNFNNSLVNSQPGAIPNPNPSSASEAECLLYNPTGSNCTRNSSSTESTHRALMEELLMNQAVATLTYMNQCFQGYLERTPTSGTESEIEVRKLQGHVALVQCFQWIYGRMIEAIPWLESQAQPMQETNDAAFLQLLIQLLSQD
jgi:hypothetical protein